MIIWTYDIALGMQTHAQKAKDTFLQTETHASMHSHTDTIPHPPTQQEQKKTIPIKTCT